MPRRARNICHTFHTQPTAKLVRVPVARTRSPTRTQTNTTHALDAPRNRSDGAPIGSEGAEAPQPIRRDEPKVGRNDPCPCGSGKKYKKCHGVAG